MLTSFKKINKYFVKNSGITMKKLIYLLIVFAALSFTYGKQIDENTARMVGQNFISFRNSTSKILNSNELELVYKVTSNEKNNFTPIKPIVYFYVFNINSTHGFIIVSGDDNVIPVLGYSDETGFRLDNIPENVTKWLEGYKSEIRYIINNNIQASNEIKTKWQLYLNHKISKDNIKNTNSVSPLLQTKWNQSPYYNDMCPYDNQNNARTVTGCVATAMAQIMKYWNYPSNGTGFHSYNESTFGTLSANFGSTTYDWGSMPNDVSSSNSAVATLMYHCGVSIDMSYGVHGSYGYVISSQSPDTNCAEYALKTYFSYKSTLQGVQRANYSGTSWISLLKTELDASRPVLYAGFGNGGGHCFVCDGYDNNDFFHFNWGWGGYYDGYFAVDNLNPDGLGTGGGTGEYNSNQQAVIGIEAPTNVQTYDIQLYNYVTPSAGTINYGQAFDVTTDIVNNGTSNFTGDYCAAIFDNNYVFLDFVEIKTGMTLPGGSHYTNGVTFTTNGMLSMLPGTYYVGIFYRPTGGNWVKVSDMGSYTNIVQMNVINPNDIELYSTMSVTPGTTLTQGEAVSVNVDIINNGASTFYGTYDVSLFKLDGSLAFDIQALSENNGLQPGYHYTGGLTFSNSVLNLEPGTYLLAVLHKPNGGNWELTGSTNNYLNPIFVTVQGPVSQPDIYEPNNTVEQAYSLPVNFSNNSASVNTEGSNCHVGTDYDYYKIVLPSGFNYNIGARLQDSYNSNNGKTYTLDALFSDSTDGGTWSDTYDYIMPNNIILNNGGTVYFYVAPFFAGATGTYRLDINITRTPSDGVKETYISNADIINVYPNPAIDFINVNMSDFSGKIYRIQILNVEGQVVFDISPDNSSSALRIPVDKFSAGMYIFQFRTDKGIISKKIMVSK
jgi:hypothetical protein